MALEYTNGTFIPNVRISLKTSKQTIINEFNPEKRAELGDKTMKTDLKTEQAAFTIQEMLPIGLTIVVLGIALAYGLQVMGDVKGDMTASSAEANATQDAIDGVAKLPEKLPTIVGVVVAAIIIGIVIRYFMQR